MCVLFSLPIFPEQDMDDYDLDPVKGNTVELVIAKSEVEVLYRQWLVAKTLLCRSQNSPAYTE